tara:strand:+ start:323 stop:1135 length:813 start_codon:yes stop_codon:yes gene_type:complete
MKIFDCFSYWDEDLLLDVRLNVMNNFVDYFVIVEGNKTWQNNSKKLKFDLNKFKKFKDKIIYVSVEDMPDGDNPYERENFQRNCISRGIKKAEDDDLIIISDLDEIPNPSLIKNFDKGMRYAVFEQKLFYYKFNLQSVSQPYWYGSRICVKKFLKSPQWLRNLKFRRRPWWRIDKFRLNHILEGGGWHFCNLKDTEKLLYKYKNMCETKDLYVFKEQIDPKYLDVNEIKKSIDSGVDLIGRGHKYKKVEIDENYPKYILDNSNKFKDWII